MTSYFSAYFLGQSLSSILAAPQHQSRRLTRLQINTLPYKRHLKAFKSRPQSVQFSGKQTGQTLIAVRETGVSRHQGGPIEVPLEIPRTLQHYRIKGIKGVPDLGTKGNGIFF